MRGALLVVLSMGFFVATDGLMKSLSGALAWYQALALRGGLAVMLCVGLALVIDGRRPISTVIAYARSGPCALRIGFELAATCFYLLAIFNMPLADATAIVQLLPILLTLGGAVFFAEKIGWRRIAAASIGFVGVLLIIQPGTTAFRPVALLALAATFSMAGRDLATRALPSEIPSTYVTALTMLAVWLMSLFLALASEWPQIEAWMLVRLACAAVTVTLAYWLSVTAVRAGEVRFLAPFRYSSIVWGLIIGFAAFGERPGLIMLVGAALVVGAGLYTLYRERVTGH